MPLRFIWFRIRLRSRRANAHEGAEAPASRTRKDRKLPPNLEQLECRLAPDASLTSVNQQILSAYGQLPISFEANAGQTAAQVQYLAHGSGYSLFLTSNSAVLSLPQPTSAPANSPLSPTATDASAPSTSTTGVALAMTLLGANSQAAVVGQDQLPGTSNYFVGNDPSQWFTNIANYGQVAYQGVYPGVNLVYYGNQTQLEYDFDVAPGADPGNIRFSVQGADSLSLDSQGNLVLQTASGDVLEHAPVIYQTVGGVKQTVAGQFVLLGNNEVGFQVGSYNASQPLVIDPVLIYSTYLGGNGDDVGNGIAVDAAGDAYITGGTASLNFPTPPGAFQTSDGGGTSDAFVTKLNATGTAVIYSTYLGGNGNDVASGIAVDGSGNAYVSGNTGSSNFPTTPGAYEMNGPFFVTKLNASGSSLVYSTYLNPDNPDYPYDAGIAVDGSGQAYVVGYSYVNSSSGQQGFLIKLNANGTGMVYNTLFSGQDNTFTNCEGIAVDALGDAYVTGATTSPYLPTTTGAYQASFAGSEDAYVAELNPSGTALLYCTYLGGGVTLGYPIGVDSSGAAYITGESTDLPTTADAFLSNNGSGDNDVFVTKLNANGSALVYSTLLGGLGIDYRYGIAVDGSGDAYVTGATDSTNFPTTTDAYQTQLRRRAQ